MWEIWANSLLLKALKSSPKSNKLPNLVTLYDVEERIIMSQYQSYFIPKFGHERCNFVKD